MPFVNGETIGPYRLLNQLGQGGMATVYKAYHAALDRYVAIKVLHLAFTEDHNFLARFQREARVVARLEHPNIVPIYDSSEYENRPFLVMKFIEGETLKARLERQRPTLPEIVGIVERVGGALAYAHQQGVLHRDIKPSNVLMAQDGHVYLTDFGLARMAEAGESTLTADRMVGTPQYMSPEQGLSKPDLDVRTDIYSFGVMMYEMLVGQVPYSADTPFAIIHDHIYTPLPLPREINPNISEAVERVLLKALAKNPDDRFATMDALVTAFQVAATQEPAASAAAVLAAPLPPMVLPPSTPTDGAPTLLPQETAPARRSSVSETSAPAAQAISIPTPQAPAKPAKRNYTPWIIAAGVLLVLFACVLLGTSFLAKNSSSKAKTTIARTQSAAAQLLTSGPIVEVNPTAVKVAPKSTKTPLNTPELTASQTSAVETPAADQPTSDVNPAMADKLLAIAIDQWSQGNHTQALDTFQQVRDAAGPNVAFYRDAVRLLADKGLFVMAAELLYPRSRPVLQVFIDKTQNERVREILYYAAKDPDAAALMKRNSALPIFTIAEMRFELYNGDPQKAADALDALLADNLKTNRFPEARLLDVEMFVYDNDLASARASMAELLADKPNLPDWVYNAAVKLDAELNPK